MHRSLASCQEPFSPAQFDAIDVFYAGTRDRHYRVASIEVRLSSPHLDLLVSALGRPSWRHIGAVWSPESHDLAGQRITLQVRMPLLAHWSTAWRWAAIRRRVIRHLDAVQISYTVTHVETGGIAYLRKNTIEDPRL